MHTIDFIPFCPGRNQVELLPTHFGQMLTYSDDQVIRNIIKQTGAFTEQHIIPVTRALKNLYDFTPEIFVDIGANIGTHSIFAVKSGIYEQVIAIEPDPRNFQLLVMNSILNKVHGQILFNSKALSNETKDAKFELSPNNFGDHRVITESTGVDGVFDEVKWERIMIETDLLDNVITTPLSRNNTLVWVDIQGHEGHMFEGAKEKFHGDDSPYIVCEFYPYGLLRSGGLTKFFNFLETRSRIIILGEHRWEETNRTVAETIELLRSFVVDNSTTEWHLDLLLIP